MFPTISDISDKRETPEILKNFTTVPDSDDEEGEEPDAQVLVLSQSPASDIQMPAFPHQTFREEGAPKAATFQSASKVTIEEQGQRGEDTATTASLAALKGANSPTVKIASSDITSSISMAAMEPPGKKHAATQPLASMEQSIQGTEVQQATELPSSLTDVQARAMPRTTSITERSSQATDIPSSPPQVIRRESYTTKKRESPPASFIVPEALQSKDILMAELKAMKIVSPPMLLVSTAPVTFAGTHLSSPSNLSQVKPLYRLNLGLPLFFYINGYWTDICVLRHLYKTASLHWRLRSQQSGQSWLRW